MVRVKSQGLRTEFAIDAKMLYSIVLETAKNGGSRVSTSDSGYGTAEFNLVREHPEGTWGDQIMLTLRPKDERGDALSVIFDDDSLLDFAEALTCLQEAIRSTRRGRSRKS